MDNLHDSGRPGAISEAPNVGAPAGPWHFGLSTMCLWVVLATAWDLLVVGEWEVADSLAAVFFALFWGGVLGVFLGAFLRLILDEPPTRWVQRRVKGCGAFLVRRDADAAKRFDVWLVGLAVGLLWMLVAGFLLVERIAIGVTRPHFQASLSVLAMLAVLVTALPLGLAAGRLTAVFHGLLERLSDRRLRGSRPLWSILVCAAFCLVLSGVLAVRFSEAILLSPWQGPVQHLLALVLALGIFFPAERWIRRTGHRRILLGLIALVVMVTALAAFSLSSDAPGIRSRYQEGRAIRLTWGTLNQILDWDDDGFMGPFGGGDCAPWDKDISPGAIDIPENGIDEDCSGSDVLAENTLSARWDFALGELEERLGRGHDGNRRRLPVIILTNDAMSANHVGFEGYERPVSPNLDQLAEGCVRFHQAFSQGPSTRISLPSFFTSRWDTQTEREPVGKNPYPFAESNLTMAEVFRDNGYDTIAVVPKWYFTSMWKGILQGFDTVDKSPITHYKEKEGRVHNAKWVTEAALKHLEKKREKPLFMWIHYYDVHFPYRQPETAPVFGETRMDIFDAEMVHWDREVKPVFDALDKRFGKGGYVLIVTSDHGSVFDERHPKFANGYNLYSGTLHIPMLWCSPFWSPGDVEDTPVILLDILPTLVNLLGLEGDFDFEGSSLVPFLRGNPGPEWKDRIIFHQYFLFEKTTRGMDPLFKAAARSKDFNYIWDRRKDKRELYAWPEDPFETSDLIEEKAELAEGMHSTLQSWLYRVHRRYNPSWKEEGGGEADPTKLPKSNP